MPTSHIFNRALSSTFLPYTFPFLNIYFYLFILGGEWKRERKGKRGGCSTYLCIYAFIGWFLKVFSDRTCNLLENTNQLRCLARITIPFSFVDWDLILNLLNHWFDIGLLTACRMGFCTVKNCWHTMKEISRVKLREYLSNCVLVFF